MMTMNNIEILTPLFYLQNFFKIFELAIAGGVNKYNFTVNTKSLK